MHVIRTCHDVKVSTTHLCNIYKAWCGKSCDPVNSFTSADLVLQQVSLTPSADIALSYAASGEHDICQGCLGAMMMTLARAVI